jgi:hypothetical protein
MCVYLFPLRARADWNTRKNGRRNSRECDTNEVHVERMRACLDKLLRWVRAQLTRVLTLIMAR